MQHAGNATDILVNQQQPSAGWFRLGAFVMSPGQNHHVEVTGALEGVTVADAVRFVSAGALATLSGGKQIIRHGKLHLV